VCIVTVSAGMIVRMLAVHLYRHRTCRENTGQAWIARIDSGRIFGFQIEFFSWQ
jgi:hypothetical protein